MNDAPAIHRGRALRRLSPSGLPAAWRRTGGVQRSCCRIAAGNEQLGGRQLDVLTSPREPMRSSATVRQRSRASPAEPSGERGRCSATCTIATRPHAWLVRVLIGDFPALPPSALESQDRRAGDPAADARRVDETEWCAAMAMLDDARASDPRRAGRAGCTRRSDHGARRTACACGRPRPVAAARSVRGARRRA